MSEQRRNPSATADDNAPQPTAKMRRKVTGLAIAAAVGGFLFGFDSSVINGAVDSIQHHFGAERLHHRASSSPSPCSAARVGAYIAGRLADRWGRIKVMLLGAVLFLVSSIGAGLAFSAWDLGLWRVVGGLGIGIASVVAPAYIAEISPRQSRGRLASLQQLAITIGIFVALLSDALLAGDRRAPRRASSGSGSRPGGGCSWSASSRRSSTASSP